jgi:ribosomal protein S18 acetylase RimI-like enzyme
MDNGCELDAEAQKAGLTTRIAGPQDEAFLFAVYADSRSDETALTNWSPEQIDGFLRMQAAAQRQDYERRFPEGVQEILLRGGRPIGRVWTAQTDGELRLLDVAILEKYRGRGSGTVLLQALQRRAAARQLPLRLSVWKAHGHIIRFYQRLGFSPAGDMGIYLAMEWRPETSKSSASPPIPDQE